MTHNDEKENAVIYCRVSTRDQVEEGNSLATQQRLCKEYALQYGYNVSHVFIEEGESAKTANRTQLGKMIELCKLRKNNIKAVIVYKLDRLSRNTDDYSFIRVTLKSYGVEIKSTSEYLSDDPAGRFMENIIANVAQFDNDVRTERSVNGMKDAMREGRYIWQAPIGYKNVRLLGKATIIPDEMANCITQIFNQVALNSRPAEDIRLEVNRKGLLNKGGKPIAKSHFYKILRNDVYTGIISKFGESHQGVYQPLVSKEIFEQVKSVLSGKLRSYAYKVKHPDFPLRQFVSVPSGEKLTGSWSRGRGGTYAYYFARKSKVHVKKHILESKFITLLKKFSVDGALFDSFFERAKYFLSESQKEKVERVADLNKRVSELKARQTSLISRNLDGVISNDLLKGQLRLIEDELIETRSKLILNEITPMNPEVLLEKCKEFIFDPAEAWRKAKSVTSKLNLQWFYFPKGVEFDGEKCRTTEICRLFKAKIALFDLNYPKVTLRDQKSNKLQMPLPQEKRLKTYWKVFEEELTVLHDIISSGF